MAKLSLSYKKVYVGAPLATWWWVVRWPPKEEYKDLQLLSFEHENVITLQLWLK